MYEAWFQVLTRTKCPHLQIWQQSLTDLANKLFSGESYTLLYPSQLPKACIFRETYSMVTYLSALQLLWSLTNNHFPLSYLLSLLCFSQSAGLLLDIRVCRGHAHRTARCSPGLSSSCPLCLLPVWLFLRSQILVKADPWVAVDFHGTRGFWNFTACLKARTSIL